MRLRAVGARPAVQRTGGSPTAPPGTAATVSKSRIRDRNASGQQSGLGRPSRPRGDDPAGVVGGEERSAQVLGQPLERGGLRGVDGDGLLPEGQVLAAVDDRRDQVVRGDPARPRRRFRCSMSGRSCCKSLSGSSSSSAPDRRRRETRPPCDCGGRAVRRSPSTAVGRSVTGPRVGLPWCALPTASLRSPAGAHRAPT